MATAEEVRAWVYETLLGDSRQRQTCPSMPALQLSDLEGRIKAKLQGTGEMTPEPHGHYAELPERYKHQIREIVWGLVIQGIVVPGANSQDAGLPFMQITEWGKKCLEAGEYLPHDAGQFISRIRGKISGIDASVLLYLKESLIAFRSGAYLASAVMTGVACERTLLLLRDSVENALPTGQHRTSFESKTKNQQVKRVFDEIWKRLDPVHRKLATDLGKEDVKAELSGSFDLIRKTRNDTGHPTGREISREEAHNLLLLFPQYCQAAYGAMDWLKSNPLP